ncbi:hypothetical protein [Streptomyces sioyaensis]|uniref:hypothetical protein n=1 Tax=Streptomyces sioyaensis TaxID=67364 RepID=UPI0037AE316A
MAGTVSTTRASGCAAVRLPGRDGVLDTLIEDVSRHTGGASADDMALLAVQRPLGA